MTKKYRRYEPNQTYLIAPDIRDWLPKGHLAFFLNDTVKTLDLSDIYMYYERSDRGQPPYDPAMMTRVLLYAYCIGRSSSRKIARAMYDDVAFRFLGAGNFPDFRTVSEFRRIHLKQLSKLFIQVLRLCVEADLVSNKVAAIDGLKIKANASLDSNMDYKTLCKEEKRLRKQIEEDLKRAIEIDEEEDRKFGKDKQGDELPPWTKDPEERMRRIRKAKEDLERKQKEIREKYDTRVEERAKEEAETGKKVRGRKLKVVPKEPENDTKRNTTDPDSRIMKARQGFVQGFNAQLAVDSKNQIIIAYDVVQDENDQHQLISIYEKIKENLGRLPDALTLDAGYWCEEEIRKILELIDLYIATSKDWKQRKALREKPPPRGRIPKDMSLRDRMERKLLTKRGRRTYKMRGKTVEPVNGQIKDARGFRQFLLRGIEKVKGEFALIVTTGNILKLWRYGNKVVSG